MRKPVFAILLLAVLSLSCSGRASSPKWRAQGLVQRSNVLVFPFEYHGSRDSSWIAAGLCDSLITDLKSVQGINVFSEADRVRAVRELQLGMTGLIRESDRRRVGGLMGASVLLTGSVQVAGKAVRVNARMVHVETGRIIRSAKVDGTMDGIFNLQDRVIIALLSPPEKGMPAESSVVIGKEDSERLPSTQKPNRDAYAWYARGLQVHYTELKKAMGFYLKAIGIDPDYVQALNKIGEICKEMNRFEDALRYHGRAEVILAARGKKKSGDYARTVNYIGSVYWNKGAYDEALRHYNRAQNLREEIGLKSSGDYAETLGNIGTVYLQKGDTDRAMKCFFSSREMYEALGLSDTIETVNLTANTGTAYFRKGDHEKALLLYQQAVATLQKIRMTATKSHAVLASNIGSIYLLKGDAPSALNHYLQARDTWIRLGLKNTYDYGTTVANIGVLYQKTGALCKGVPFL